MRRTFNQLRDRLSDFDLKLTTDPDNQLYTVEPIFGRIEGDFDNPYYLLRDIEEICVNEEEYCD